MQTSLTDQFIDRLESIEASAIPGNVLHHARRCFLDYLGAAFAGEALLREKTARLVSALGSAKGKFPVVGSELHVDRSTATFLNGIHSHYVELDDGVIAGIIHPGTPIFSALIPWAGAGGVTGLDFMRGVVMGYEASVRLAEAIQPAHKACGYHATATCGSVGAAWAICSMLNESIAVKKDSFSAVTARAGGSLKVLEDESQLKPVNSGHAAMMGNNSVALAQAGFLGPEDALLGRNGFIRMMTSDYNLERLTRMEDKYSIEDTYFKPYAACRYCHPAIEAVMQMQESHSIDVGEIDSVSVYTYELAVAKHDHQEITGVSSAKMSIPISVAITFITGKASINEYSVPILERSEIQTLARKVTATASEEYTKAFPKKSQARLELVLKDGRRIEQTVEYPKGEPDFPLSDQELTEKFLSLAEFSGMSSEHAREISQRIWDLPNDFDKLSPLLHRAR